MVTNFLLIDKSTLQALNQEERLGLRERFLVMAPVVLLAEIFADLVKPSTAASGASQLGGVAGVRSLSLAFDPHEVDYSRHALPIGRSRI